MEIYLNWYIKEISLARFCDYIDTKVVTPMLYQKTKPPSIHHNI